MTDSPSLDRLPETDVIANSNRLSVIFIVMHMNELLGKSAAHFAFSIDGILAGGGGQCGSPCRHVSVASVAAVFQWQL